MGTETDGSVRLTILAGRWIAGIAALHLVFFVVVSWDFLGGWLTGALWFQSSLAGPMSRSEAHFWPFLGSFAVPLLLLVRAALRADRLPARPGAGGAAGQGRAGTTAVASTSISHSGLASAATCAIVSAG